MKSEARVGRGGVKTGLIEVTSKNTTRAGSIGSRVFREVEAANFRE